MKITDVIWFTATDKTIGIVMGREEVSDKPKAYIGVGDGGSEEVDTRHIIEWGAKLPKEIVEQLSKHFT